jgi:hypothetical protein
MPDEGQHRMVTIRKLLDRDPDEQGQDRRHDGVDPQGRLRVLVDLDLREDPFRPLGHLHPRDARRGPAPDGDDPQGARPAPLGRRADCASL